METSPRYTTLVRQYWNHHRPVATAQLEDPEVFFARMGARIATAVVALMHQLQGEDRPWEEPMEKIARVNMDRLRAEEVVLAQELYEVWPAEVSPQEQLEELLAALPSPEMIADALTEIDLEVQTQSDMEDTDRPVITVEQMQRQLTLRELRPLVGLSVEQIEAMSPDEAGERARVLRRYVSMLQPG